MLVSENYDEDIIYLARMAPTRWFRGSEAFGITEAPTRFGRVNFTMSKTTTGQAGLAGNASLRLRPGMTSPTIALRLSSGVAGQAFKCVRVDGGGKLLAWHAQNETAWVAGAAFGFSAHLAAPC